ALGRTAGRGASVEDELDAFEKHYGRDIKLPKETL
ncbi:hypothetical protein LCGC14_2360370, partial [marine sediment metagenome]